MSPLRGLAEDRLGSATPPIVMEDVGCPLQCPRLDDAVLIGRDLLHNIPGEFVVVRCRSCGLMRTNPRPTLSAMSAYYPEDYHPYLDTTVSKAPTSSGGARATLRSVLKRLFEFNTMRLPARLPGRMLEVGCASGSFMHQMAGQGWKVEGIEVSPTAACAAASLGYKVHAGAVEDAPDPGQPFDVVVGWMVFEHLHQPLLALRKLRSWTKPGGWLVLSLPNAGSWDFRAFRDVWYALHLPNHLYHYTRRTIALMLSASGWKLEQIHFHRVLVDPIASCGYVLRDLGMMRLGAALTRVPGNPAYWNYLLFPVASVAASFGQTGRMTIWARNAS